MSSRLGLCSRPVQLWAAGSSDRSVSLWAVDAKRPIVCVVELFTSVVTDLSLRGDSEGGIELVACAQDGTVKCLRLAKSELSDLDVQPIHVPKAAEATRVAVPPPTAQKEEVVVTPTGAKRRRITPEFHH